MPRNSTPETCYYCDFCRFRQSIIAPVSSKPYPNARYHLDSAIALLIPKCTPSKMVFGFFPYEGLYIEDPQNSSCEGFRQSNP